jgi:hypothetical protein
MTKRTPLREYRAALEKRNAAQEKARDRFESKKLDAIERALDDREKIWRIETDPNLSPDERLALCKSLLGWARMVLGMYGAELEAVSADDVGRRSEIAYEKVGKVVGLGPDRIKALCNEGRRQLKEGMSAELAVRMTAAKFERRMLRRNRTAKRKRTA